MMSDPPIIRCAILGTGMSTTVFHAPFIQSLPEHYELYSILERRATPTHSEARDRYGSKVKVVTTIEQILEDPLVDLVFVCTINETHYDFAKRALQAGKHVVIEKPITPTSAEAKELHQLAKDQKLILAVYQNRRWDSDYLTVKSLINSKVFGELAEFESRFDRYKNIPAVKLWKEANSPGTGAAYDLGSHLIDQILDLFGKPNRVTAILSNSRLIGDRDVPDAFIIHLHYDATTKSGRTLPLIATARGSILSLVAPQLRFTVKGTKAAFTKSGVDGQEDSLKLDAKAPSKPRFGVEPKDLQGTLYELDKPGQSTKIESKVGNYQKWFINVAEAIHDKDPSHLIVTPEQAILTMEIIELATRSSKEGITLDV